MIKCSFFFFFLLTLSFPRLGASIPRRHRWVGAGLTTSASSGTICNPNGSGRSTRRLAGWPNDSFAAITITIITFFITFGFFCNFVLYVMHSKSLPYFFWGRIIHLDPFELAVGTHSCFIISSTHLFSSIPPVFLHGSSKTIRDSLEIWNYLSSPAFQPCIP